MGREVGGGFRMEGHVYTYGQFILMHGKKPSQYCKVITLQFKQIHKCFKKNKPMLVPDVQQGVSTAHIKTYSLLGMSFQNSVK